MADTGNQMTLNQADVATILDELRSEVRARRMTLGQIEPSPLERDLQRGLDEIELYRVVSAHWPLIGKSFPQRAVALVNKLVRRYLRWYINPIVEQQNAYNDAVARTLRLLADAYLDLGEQIVENKETKSQEPRTKNQESSKGYRPTESTEHQGQADKEASKQEFQKHIENEFSILNSQFSILDLQSLVRERAAAEPPAHFPDLELQATEPWLRLPNQVNPHWPLVGTTARQRVVALVNKLVRRYLRWYINPIVEQQNAANAAICAALLVFIRLDAERRAQIAHMRSQEPGARSEKLLTPDS
jgi:hypothetical protein